MYAKQAIDRTPHRSGAESETGSWVHGGQLVQEQPARGCFRLHPEVFLMQKASSWVFSSTSLIS